MSRAARIPLFLAATIIFSSPWWWLARAYGGGSYITLLMWSPALAAVVSLKLSGGSLELLGWRGARWKWIAAAWLVTLLALCATHLLVFGAGLVTFPAAASLAERAKSLGAAGLPAPLALVWYATMLVTAGVIRLAGPALGEELGWRGFLAPEACARFGFARGALLSGAAWAAWHYPLMIGRETPIHIVNFTLAIVGMGVAYAWFRLKSESVWPTTVMHALHNALIPVFFVNLAPEGAASAQWLDETGYALAGMGVTLAIIFLTIARIHPPTVVAAQS